MAIFHSFFLTPFVGRLTWQRFLLTYVLPLAPAIILWDGLVSVFRTYTPDELTAMAQSIDDSNYDWEAGRMEIPGSAGILMPTIFLVGSPGVSALVS